MNSEIRSRVFEFSSEFRQDYWRKIYSTRSFPEEYWYSFSSKGLIGFLVSKDFGGLGLDLSNFCSAVQLTARYYAGAASYLFLSSCLSALIIERLGSESMKKEILPRLISGKSSLCIALTEENSGLDASSIETHATRKEESYIINGRKMFVSNLDRCEYMLLFARSEEGITAFLLETKNKAIEKKEIDKIGLEFIKLFSVDIKSLEVGRESILGKLGAGLKQMEEIFLMDRLATSSLLIGTGLLALDEASEYAKDRVAFGRKIGSNQGIQFPLADSACRLIASEALLMKACLEFNKDKGLVNTALLEAQNAASVATDTALQTFGGHGYLAEKDVGRHWKDVRAYRLHPLSEEIILASIGWRSLGLPKTY